MRGNKKEAFPRDGTLWIASDRDSDSKDTTQTLRLQEFFRWSESGGGGSHRRKYDY